MTLTTMTTVGYMEIHPLSHVGRVFNSFLIFFGVTTIFIAIGAMTQTIIELEFGDAIGKRRNKRMIDKLKDHYIICGFGRVGRGAADELQHAGVPFVVVDINPERVERAMLAGMLAVDADSTRDETLRLVGIDRARGLVAALATDADNLFVLLSAKGLNSRIYVATRAAEEGAEAEDAAGRRRRRVRALRHHRAPPGAVAAPAARGAVSRLHDQGHRAWTFRSSRCASRQSSEMVSKSIKEMQLGRDFGVIVMAIRTSRRPDASSIPPPNRTVKAGDYLIVMGSQENLRALEVDCVSGRAWPARRDRIQGAASGKRL